MGRKTAESSDPVCEDVCCREVLVSHLQLAVVEFLDALYRRMLNVAIGALHLTVGPRRVCGVLQWTDRTRCPEGRSLGVASYYDLINRNLQTRSTIKYFAFVFMLAAGDFGQK